MSVEEKCTICNGEKKHKKAATCSRACGEELKRRSIYEVRECKMCSAIFEERKKKERAFCSDQCRKEWQLRPENIEARMNKTRQAVYEKYGVETVFDLKDVQHKAAEGMRKTLADNGAERTRRIKATKLERYGDENFNNAEKGAETKWREYGDKNFNNREEAKRTMKKKFGFDHAMQNEEVRKRASDSLLKSHGVAVPLQSEEVKKRMMQTVNEKYGVESYSKTDEFKERVTKTWLDRIETTKQFELIMQLSSNEIELLDDFVGFKRGGTYVDYRFKCKRCNSVFNRKFCNPTIPICRKCYPSPKSPRTHDAIRNALKKNNVVFTENSRRILKGLELDFFLENDNLAVELNGNYFHSERAGEKSKEYHLNKTMLSTDKGIKLIHVFEDEIMKKKDIVIGRIMALLNKSSVSIGARECKMVKCSFEQKKAFFSENHIQGDTPSKIAIGLMYEEQLVAIMSFGTPRKALGSKSGEMTGHYELLRFCTKIDHNVAGAFSRILSYFKKHHDPKCITTFADIRWSGHDPLGTVYAKNGFEFESFSRPNYWYFKRGDYMTRYHRFKFRKDVLVKQAIGAGLVQNEERAKKFTEWELAQLMGMDRIWDCGSMKFSWSSATN